MSDHEILESVRVRLDALDSFIATAKAEIAALEARRPASGETLGAATACASCGGKRWRLEVQPVGGTMSVPCYVCAPLEALVVAPPDDVSTLRAQLADVTAERDAALDAAEAIGAERDYLAAQRDLALDVPLRERATVATLRTERDDLARRLADAERARDHHLAAVAVGARDSVRMTQQILERDALLLAMAARVATLRGALGRVRDAKTWPELWTLHDAVTEALAADDAATRHIDPA